MPGVHYVPCGEFILVYVCDELVDHFSCGDPATVDKRASLLNA
ncbi:hypothetical protein [Secundilactobacillus muriivasis]